MKHERSSGAVSLVSLGQKKSEQLADALSEEEARAGLDDWPSWARPEQLPPDPSLGREWTTWVFLGGRGAGKTRAGAEWIRALVETAGRPLRIALVAETYHDARMTMVEGESGLLALGPAALRPKFLPSLRELRWTNGSRAQLFSSEDPEALRGPQFHAAWADELAKWRHGAETWAMLQMALRLGRHPRQVVTTTPRPAPHLKEILAAETTVTTHATSYDNRANLAPAFFSHIIRRYEGTALGRQELAGELIDAIEGTLFARADVERARLRAAPDLERIVVAVDPPVTTGEDADECGIAVAGRAGDHAYVLADKSVHGLSPLGWAARVVEAAHEFEAERVVVEVNQGGDLVEEILRQVDPMLSVRRVHATRGKSVRAEPVAALYERGLVHHIGLFASLEDQMASFVTGGVQGPSPDRVDALVWALTDLMLASREPKPRMRRV